MQLRKLLTSNTVEGNTGKVILYRNKHDGTFEDVSAEMGLKNIAFAMGSNFGDIDNDGYLGFLSWNGQPFFQISDYQINYLKI